MADQLLGPRWRFWRRRRDVLVVLTFLGFVDVILLRMSRKYFYCKALENSQDTTFQGSLLRWLTTDHGTSSNAFLYGYLLTVIPGGFLATKIRGQRLYGIRAVISVVVTLLIWASNTVNSQFILAIMFLEGLCRGLVDPSIMCIWSQWFSLSERNRLIYFSMCGVPVGHILAYVLVDGGRDCYKTELTGLVNTILFQILGVGWSLVWCLTVKDSPRKDPSISPEELHHIEKCLTMDGASGPDETTIFLREVFASLPAWACVIASFAFSWNLASLLQQDALPPFSSEFGNHGKEDARTAILFTYTFVVLGMVIFGFANDVMSRKHSFITNSRKVVICGSLMLSSGTMLLCCFFVWGPLLLLCYSASLCFGFIGGAAVCVNLVDVASLQSSVLAGFGLVAGSLASIVVSKLTPYILQIETGYEYLSVALISVVVCMEAALFYGKFGSAHVQEWAVHANSRPNKDNSLQSKILTI